jgi:hypothetical protein
MKSLKSVAVAVVLGSLLCSGGLVVAASSSTSTDASSSSVIDIKLVNNTIHYMDLEQGNTDLVSVSAGSQLCGSWTTCTYQGKPGDTYTVQAWTVVGDLGSSIVASYSLKSLSENTTVTCTYVAPIKHTIICSSAATN